MCALLRGVAVDSPEPTHCERSAKHTRNLRPVVTATPRLQSVVETTSYFSKQRRRVRFEIRIRMRELVHKIISVRLYLDKPHAL